MALNFSTGILVGDGSPVDIRYRVGPGDFYTSLDNIPTGLVYEGLVVYDNVNNRLVIYTGADFPTSPIPDAEWEVVGSGGGGGTSIVSGLIFPTVGLVDGTLFILEFPETLTFVRGAAPAATTVILGTRALDIVDDANEIIPIGLYRYEANVLDWIRVEPISTAADVTIVGNDVEFAAATANATEGDLLYTTADVQAADITAPLTYGDPVTGLLTGEATVSDFTVRNINTPNSQFDLQGNEQLVIGFQQSGVSTALGILTEDQTLLVVGEVLFINNERYEILRLGEEFTNQGVIAYLDNAPADGTGIIPTDSRIFYPAPTLTANTLHIRDGNVWDNVEALTRNQKEILSRLSITNVGFNSILHAEHFDVNDLTHNGDAFVQVAANNKSVSIGGVSYSQETAITDILNEGATTTAGQYLRATTFGVEITPNGEFVDGSFSGTVTGNDPVHGTDLVTRRWSEEQARRHSAVIDAYITEILALYTDVIPEEVTSDRFVLRDETRETDGDPLERHVGVAGFRQYSTPTPNTSTPQSDWFGYFQGTADRPGEINDGYPIQRHPDAIDFRPIFALGLNSINIDTDSNGRATAHYPPFETIDVPSTITLTINGTHGANAQTVNFIAQPGIGPGDLVGHSFIHGGIIHQIIANTAISFESLQPLGAILNPPTLELEPGINFIEHVPGNFGSGTSNGDIQASRSFGFGGEIIQSLPTDPNFLFIPERTHQPSLDVLNPLGGYKNPLFTFTTPTSIQGGIEQRFAANFGQPATEGRLLNPGEAGGPKGFTVNMSLQLREDTNPNNVPYPIWSIETGNEQQAFGLWYIPYGWNGNIPNSNITNVSFIDNGRFRDVTPDNQFFPNGLHGQLGEVAFLITNSGDFNTGHNNNDSRAHFRARPRIVRLPAFETRPEEFRRVDLSTWTDLSLTFYEKIEHNHRTVFFRVSAYEVTGTGKVLRLHDIDGGSTGQYTNHRGENTGGQTIWNKPGGIKFQFGASSGVNVDSSTNHDNIRFPGFMSDVFVAAVVPNADGQFVDPANPTRTWSHFITDADEESEGYKNSLQREILYPIHVNRLPEARVPGVTHSRTQPIWDLVGRMETPGEFIVQVHNPIDQVDRIDNETIYNLIGNTGQEIDGVRSLLTIPHNEDGVALDGFDTDGSQNIIDLGIPLDGNEDLTQRRLLRSNNFVPLTVGRIVDSTFAGADYTISFTDAVASPVLHSRNGIDNFDDIRNGARFHFSGGGEGIVRRIESTGATASFDLEVSQNSFRPLLGETAGFGSIVNTVTSRSIDRNPNESFMEEFYTPNITPDRLYTRYRVVQTGTAGTDLATTLVFTEANDVWGRDPRDPNFRDPTVRNSPAGAITPPDDDLIFYSYRGLQGLQNLNGRFAGTSNWDIAGENDVARVYIPQFRAGFTSDGVHINLNPETELIRATFVSLTDENDRIERDFSIEPLETDLSIGQVGISRRGIGTTLGDPIPDGYETEPRFALADDRWRLGLNTPIVLYSNRLTQLPAPLENEIINLDPTDTGNPTTGQTIIDSRTIAILLGENGPDGSETRFFMNISDLPVTIGPFGAGTTAEEAITRYNTAVSFLTSQTQTWREIGAGTGGGGTVAGEIEVDPLTLNGDGSEQNPLTVHVQEADSNLLEVAGGDGGLIVHAPGSAPYQRSFEFSGTSPALASGLADGVELSANQAFEYPADTLPGQANLTVSATNLRLFTSPTVESALNAFNGNGGGRTYTVDNLSGVFTEAVAPDGSQLLGSILLTQTVDRGTTFNEAVWNLETTSTNGYNRDLRGNAQIYVNPDNTYLVYLVNTMPAEIANQPNRVQPQTRFNQAHRNFANIVTGNNQGVPFPHRSNVGSDGAWYYARKPDGTRFTSANVRQLRNGGSPDFISVSAGNAIQIAKLDWGGGGSTTTIGTTGTLDGGAGLPQGGGHIAANDSRFFANGTFAFPNTGGAGQPEFIDTQRHLGTRDVAGTDQGDIYPIFADSNIGGANRSIQPQITGLTGSYRTPSPVPSIRVSITNTVDAAASETFDIRLLALDPSQTTLANPNNATNLLNRLGQSLTSRLNDIVVENGLVNAAGEVEDWIWTLGLSAVNEIVQLTGPTNIVGGNGLLPGDTLRVEATVNGVQVTENIVAVGNIISLTQTDPQTTFTLGTTNEGTNKIISFSRAATPNAFTVLTNNFYTIDPAVAAQPGATRDEGGITRVFGQSISNQFDNRYVFGISLIPNGTTFDPMILESNITGQARAGLDTFRVAYFGAEATAGANVLSTPVEEFIQIAIPPASSSAAAARFIAASTLSDAVSFTQDPSNNNIVIVSSVSRVQHVDDNAVRADLFNVGTPGITIDATTLITAGSGGASSSLNAGLTGTTLRETSNLFFDDSAFTVISRVGDTLTLGAPPANVAGFITYSGVVTGGRVVSRTFDTSSAADSSLPGSQSFEDTGITYSVFNGTATVTYIRTFIQQNGARIGERLYATTIENDNRIYVRTY